MLSFIQADTLWSMLLTRYSEYLWVQLCQPIIEYSWYMVVGGVSRVDGMSGVKGVRRVSDTASSYDFLEFQTWIRVDCYWTFFRFLKRALCCWSGIFLRAQFQKFSEFAQTRSTFVNTFLLLQRKFKIKFFFNVVGPQNGQIFLELVSEKQCLWASLHF